MRKKAFDLFVFMMLISCFILVLHFDLLPSHPKKNDISEIITQSEKMNIKNTVVFVYLGSRLLDSLVESMVIVAGAFSVAYIWRQDD